MDQQMDHQACTYYFRNVENVHFGDVYNNCNISRIVSPFDELLLKQKTRLQHRYRKGNMPSLLWNDSRNDLPLEKYFVPLRVDEDHLMKRFATGEQIQLNEVFFTEDVVGKRRKTRILIRGNPGFGKTTVIRKLAYDWATLLEDRHKPHYMQMFDIVVIISLLNLGENTIQEAVIRELSGNREILLEALQQTQLKFLLLLDGYDEAFNKDKVLQFLQVEADDGFFVNYTILITSRPQAANDIWGEFDRHLSILGFSKENKITYIKEILCDQNERMMKMLQKIENNQFYLELSTCPLMLHMFCCLESDNNSESLNTLTGLYTELIRLLIRRYIKKHENLDVSLFEVGDHFLGENLIQKLGFLARRLFRIPDSSTTLSEDTLHKEFCNDNNFEFITGLGILTPIQVTTNGSDNCCLNYDFIHRTIAEFLTVFYISKMSEIESQFELYNLCLKNNIHVICFFFGLLGEEILKRNSILQYFRGTVWRIDWISRFKDEISATMWDTLVLRKFIKKLSGYTHNFTKSAIWFPLHRHIEEIKAYVNPDSDNWDAARTMIETIQSCELLTTLKIFFRHCSKFQFNCDNSGKALLDIRFLMDDLIKLSLSESLKTFDIEFRNLNINDSCRSELSLRDCAQQQLSTIKNKVFGLKSLEVKNWNNNLCTVLWNVGKLNFTLTFKSDTQNIRYVVLLVSQEQFTKIVEPPFLFPGNEERMYAVVIENGTVSHMKNPFVT